MIDASAGLTMPNVISTATNVGEDTTDGWGEANKNPPGRLPKHDSDDDVVADSFYFSYTAYLTKKVRGGAPTVQQLHDAIAADVAADGNVGGTPQITSGKGGDPAQKIDAGSSSLAMIFAGNMADLHDALPFQPYLALKPLLTTTTLRQYDRAPQTF